MFKKVHHRISSADEHGKRVIGASIIVLGCAVFACSNFTVKLVSSHYNGMFISLFRFIVGAVLSIAVLQLTGRGFAMRNKKALLMRGLFGSASMILMYIGIKLTSNGRATLLSGTSPVFVALFGYFLFKERITRYNIMAILFGVAGAVTVFYDGAGYSLLGNAVCLASGLCGGFAVNFTRLARQTNNSFMVYLYPCMFGIIINIGHVPEIALIASLHDLSLLLLVGVLSFIGQILSAFAFKYIEATPGRVFGMAEIIFSITLGVLFAGEHVTPQFFGGLAIIVVGLLLNLYGMSRKTAKAVAESE
jgi:drug/metabolite transporter (DMT)-like permease